MEYREAISILKTWRVIGDKEHEALDMAISALQAQDVPDTNVGDMISRQAAIDELVKMLSYCFQVDEEEIDAVETTLKNLPSVEPERKYTDKELDVFAHGISLALLSKRSAQHWNYDDKTAKEIEFLDRLYEKVRAERRTDGM